MMVRALFHHWSISAVAFGKCYTNQHPIKPNTKPLIFRNKKEQTHPTNRKKEREGDSVKQILIGFGKQQMEIRRQLTSTIAVCRRKRGLVIV
jgi:hypothetical protein